MLTGITLELDDGQKARIRFAETAEGGAHVVCEASRGCVHDPPVSGATFAPVRSPAFERASGGSTMCRTGLVT